MTDHLRFHIAGINFRKNVKDYVGKFTGYIQSEPTNAYDPYAIAVYADDGHHLGYIPADDTYEVRDLGLYFPIAVWGEIEECYDYERSRDYFKGLVYIDVPS